MRLAYVEHSLPAADEAGRIALARAHGLALEVANRIGRDLAPLLAAGLEVVTLEAYDLHDFHPIHPDPRRRERGFEHVCDTIEKAAAAGIPRVLAVCGFGEPCERPYEECLGFFRRVAPLAAERGVRVMIEPLSPLRAGAMTDPCEVARLLDELESPEVFTSLLDTGHVLDGGHDLVAYFTAWPHAVEEVQVRGPRSTPPPPELELRPALEALQEPPAVLCVEHRRPIAAEALPALLERLRACM